MLRSKFSDNPASIAVYVPNAPPLAPYDGLSAVQALSLGEIDHIVEHCGNHWRKIFSLYAKLCFSLDPCGFARWQDYRDRRLLQQGSGQALLFSSAEIPHAGDSLHIVTGRTYAASLALGELVWQDQDFAVNAGRRVIVSPYFDYRQLSNVKLEKLAVLVTRMQG